MNAHDATPDAPARPEAVHPAGTRFAPGPDPRRKSAWLAGLLSFMPGLGQIYVGYYRRGLAHFTTFAFLLLLLANELGGERLAPVLGMSLVFCFLYNLVDAIRRASLYNLALAGIEEVEMPRDFEWPALDRARGSLVGGALLIAVGGALFLHTRFDVPLDWVAEWWPLGIVLLGVYLVARALQDRAARGPSHAGDSDTAEAGR